jgi:hypothetical protein
MKSAMITVKFLPFSLVGTAVLSLHIFIIVDKLNTLSD